VTLGIVVNHTPWKPERVRALDAMLVELLRTDNTVELHDADYRGHPDGWQGGAKSAWVLAGWMVALDHDVDHHLFLTDDLHLAPDFVRCVETLVEVVGDEAPIGLLSNHPDAHDLCSDGLRWYATNSWLTGPAYILSHRMLEHIVEAYEALPTEQKIGPASWNDDNFVNYYVTYHGGGRTLHTLPGLVEHRADVESTVGHGDAYSRERVSWRRPWTWDVSRFTDAAFWRDRGGPKYAPMLQLPKGP
jgi:hypothetical protein